MYLDHCDVIACSLVSNCIHSVSSLQPKIVCERIATGSKLQKYAELSRGNGMHKMEQNLCLVITNEIFYAVRKSDLFQMKKQR